MGKKSVHTGASPKDRAINLMDKFITTNINRAKNQPMQSAIRKDPNIPIHMWPLKDQIEYWDTRTESDRFNDMYPAYSYWIAAVQAQSKVHPTFFTDAAMRLKPMLTERFNSKTMPKDMVVELKKHGVY
jgi:hypothetical protein